MLAVQINDDIMNIRTKELLKNTSILTISSFSSKILIFLLVPFYTSVLTTEEFGTYDLIISTIALLYPVLTLNIVDSVLRFSMDSSFEKSKIAAIGLKYTLISCLIFLFIVILVSYQDIGIDIQTLFPEIISYYIFFSLYQLLIQLSKSLDKVKDMGIAGVLSTISIILFNLLFLLYYRLGLQGFLLANVLGQFVPVIYLFYKLREFDLRIVNLTDNQLDYKMIKYSFPILVALLGWWINSTLSRFIVSFYYGLSYAGLLSVAYKIPQILNTFHSIFIQAWQISAIKEFGKEGSKEFYGKYLAVVNTFLVFACAALISFSIPLAKVLYSNDFFKAWIYVPFLLVSTIINSSSSILASVLSAKKDSKSIGLSTIIGSIICIITTLLLIDIIHVQGVTIASLISSLFIYCYRLYIVRNDIILDKKFTIITNWLILIIYSTSKIYFPSLFMDLIIFPILILLNKIILRTFLEKLIHIANKKYTL